MDLGLKDKVVLVAAASQGLGKAIAETFVQEKAKVYICSRQGATVTGTISIVCDLNDPTAIQAMIQKIGGVDVLVTNAGGPKPGQFDNISDADWQQTFNLTLMSAVRLIRATLPQMQSAHWGRIICLTSTSVKQPLDHLMTSNVMRAAVNNLAKSLANEVGKNGITVNVVAPGMFETQRLEQLLQTRAEQSGYMMAEEKDKLQRTIPLGRFGNVAELAAAVVWLASAPAGYITGTLLAVDGGLTKCS